MSKFHKDGREHWGFLYATQITQPCDFWSLMDELQDDQSGFWNNRNVLLDAFQKGLLWGLKVEPTDAMYGTGDMQDPIFAHCKWGMESICLLPCLVVMDEVDRNKCVIVWTHTRAQRLGLATELLTELQVYSAEKPLEQAKPFWDAYFASFVDGEGEGEGDI